MSCELFLFIFNFGEKSLKIWLCFKILFFIGISNVNGSDIDLEEIC